jgi:glycosyltransferase involved in cell wall biosynthesis
MRIALVGPTHPFKGGVAAHTTQTAHALAAAGHEVRLVSWSRMYPKLLYPGEQSVPGGGEDLPRFEPVRRTLRWDRPLSWWRTGRSLRDVDLVVLVAIVPVQVPALLALARSARPARVTAIVHNVVPHETHPGGRWLMERLLRAVDGVVVHSAEQGRLASAHGARSVRVAALAPHLPGGLPAPAGRARALARPPRAPGDPVRILALGMVRDYKGYDLLLEAARGVPGVRVTIAGEQWGDAGQRLRALAADPALSGRVEVRAGYVPGAQVPALMDAHDVLALPYRHATASQNVLLGHVYGLPVLATAVGTFPEEVRDGRDGLLVPPGNVAALAAALRRLAEPGRLETLRDGLGEIDPDAAWPVYVAALTDDVAVSDVALSEDAGDRGGDSGRRLPGDDLAS